MLVALIAAAACHAGAVADRSCTPGAHFHAPAKQVCVSGWSKRHRHVTTAQRHRIFARYGISYARHRHYELDHLIALEIGGNNSDSNLWPEPLTGSHGAHAKDQQENSAKRAVCSGHMSLATAQRQMVARWTRRYRPGAERPTF